MLKMPIVRRGDFRGLVLFHRGPITPTSKIPLQLRRPDWPGSSPAGPPHRWTTRFQSGRQPDFLSRPKCIRISWAERYDPPPVIWSNRVFSPATTRTLDPIPFRLLVFAPPIGAKAKHRWGVLRFTRQFRRVIDVGHDQVGVSVVVEIAECRPTTDSRYVRKAGPASFETS